MRNIFSSTKGEETTLLNEAVVAILVALLVIFVIWLVQKEWSIFTGGSAEEATLNSFEGMTNTVKTLLAELNAFKATDPNAPQTLFLGSDYVLIGYDTDWKTIFAENKVVVEECRGENSAFKPTICGKKACLCLYKMDGFNDYPEFYLETEKDDDVVSCVTYPEKIVFSADPFYPGNTGKTRDVRTMYPGGIIPSEYLGTPPEYLFLFGDNCGSGEFGTQKVYIEKLTQKDATIIHLFIQTPEQKETISKHFKKMSEYYGVSEEEVAKLIEQGQLVDATIRALRLLHSQPKMYYYLGKIFETVFTQKKEDANSFFEQITREIPPEFPGMILPFEYQQYDKKPGQSALKNALSLYFQVFTAMQYDRFAADAFVHALQLIDLVENLVERSR